MLADLKNRFAGARKAREPGEEKAAKTSSTVGGIDKKRIYTAVAALVVAGAAGHLMQRGTNPPDQVDPHMAASEIQPSQPGIEEPAPQELAMAPDEATPAPAPVEPVTLAAEMPTEEPAAAPELAMATPAELAAAPQATSPATFQEPEVTRSASVPLVDMQTPAPLADPNEVKLAAAPALEPTTPAVPLAPAIPMLDTALAAAFPAATAPAATAPTPATEAPIQLAATSEFEQPAATPGTVAPEEPAFASCEPTISAEPRAGALVALTVSAPCNSGEEVEFEHFGLKFSEQLGPDGSLDLTVPAMADDAVILASFADGTRVSTDVFVPDFAGYERAALVWKGATGLQLDAFENGATYGEPGHRWAEAPGFSAMAVDGEAGFVTVLGSTASGYAADVYTYPESLMGTTGGPELTIEAQVMENTCGQTIEGTFLRARAGQAPSVTPVTFAVPPCDAVGDYLVLKNLPQDLKIARN